MLQNATDTAKDVLANNPFGFPFFNYLEQVFLAHREKNDLCWEKGSDNLDLKRFSTLIHCSHWSKFIAQRFMEWFCVNKCIRSLQISDNHIEMAYKPDLLRMSPFVSSRAQVNQNISGFQHDKI